VVRLRLRWATRASIAGRVAGIAVGGTGNRVTAAVPTAKMLGTMRMSHTQVSTASMESTSTATKTSAPGPSDGVSEVIDRPHLDRSLGFGGLATDLGLRFTPAVRPS
jgi:hypothetical protein